MNLEPLKVVAGIDLGSTTTKAVLLTPDGRIAGAGITNTRSDYFVACAVARQEAHTAARFALLRRALVAELGESDEAKAVEDALSDAFRFEQFLDQLRALQARSRELLDVYPFSQWKEALAAPLEEVWREVDARLAGDGLSQSGSSHFFRDQAAELFMAAAEGVARGHGVAWEHLVSLFDRAVLDVETTVPDYDFPALLGRAFERAADAVGTTAPMSVLQGAIERAAHQPIEELSATGTGYGRQTLPFPKEAVRSEILCHGRGAHWSFPGTRTVLDIGGQDTKAIQVDERGVVTAFQMNDRCAAGCGRYLGYIADELNMGVHELGPLAMRAKRPARINSTCTVFAGTELRERLALGEQLEDVMAGLHRAIMLRAMSLLARSGGVHDELTFTGGVCRNAMARKLLREMVDEAYGKDITINTHPDSIYMGALGAALFALDDLRAGEPRRLDFDAPRGGPRPAPGAQAVGSGEGDSQRDRSDEQATARGGGALPGPVATPLDAYAEPHEPVLTAGVDVGTSGVQVVVARCGHLGDHADVLAHVERRIRHQDARDVARAAFEEALHLAGVAEDDIAYVASTGDGEAVVFRTGHFYSMTTHARGALYLVSEAQGTLDVGALHTRAIRIDPRGKVIGQRMTSQCASGSGQFLENIARYLGVPLEDVGRLSKTSEEPESISSICAVLAETDVINMVSRGCGAADILRGIHDSIADRLVRLVRAVRIEGPVVVTGGLSRDEGLLAALDRALAEQKRRRRMPEAVRFVTHPAGAFAGALGAALLAARRRCLLQERAAA